MNVDKLTEIAEWLEAGAPERNGVVEFDMRHFIEPNVHRLCGTTCCIAGAALQFEAAEPYADTDEVFERLFMTVGEAARYVLDLTNKQAEWLFHGRLGASPAWAARCIRKLIATGKVDWAGTEHA